MCQCVPTQWRKEPLIWVGAKVSANSRKYFGLSADCLFFLRYSEPDWYPGSANSSQAMSLDGSGVGFSDCSAGSPSNKVGLRKNSTSGNKCTRPALRFCTQLRSPTHRVSIRSRPVTLTRSATCGRSPLSQRNTLTAYSGWGWFRMRMIPAPVLLR